MRQVDTDENYVASVALTFLWPPFHDFNFYDVVVSWSLGKVSYEKKGMGLSLTDETLLLKIGALYSSQ